MEVNRLAITAVLALFVFAGFVFAAAILAPPFTSQTPSSGVIDAMFSSMIVVIVTESTLVVSIGQLVISQEDGPLGDQRSRMSDTLDFREYTQEVVRGVVPSNPSTFLSEIIQATADRATELRERFDETDDQQVRGEVDEFTESIIENADEVTDELENASFGTFDVLFAALNYNYSRKIAQVERLATEYDSHFDDADHRALQELKTALAIFGPAREHIKTLYFQWELITFTQLTLYTAVPALLVAGVMLGIVTPETFPGSTFGIANITLVVASGFAITLTPFLLFVSYFVRILTVAKRTLAIGPLVLRESQR